MTEEIIRRAENKAKAIDFLGDVCVKCGNEGTSGLVRDRLEFDHIKNDRENSKYMLSHMWACNWDRVVAELKKCQLLCHTCHVQKSIGERNYRPLSHGMRSMYVHKKCRCDKCKAVERAYWRSKHPLAPRRVA